MYIIQNGEKIKISDVDRIESFAIVGQKLDMLSWILIAIIVILVCMLLYVIFCMKCEKYEEDPAKLKPSKSETMDMDDT